MNELLKDLFYLLIGFVIVWVGFYFFTRHDTLQQRMQYYDCKLVEFNPNVPEDIILECRNQRIQEINNGKG